MAQSRKQIVPLLMLILGLQLQPGCQWNVDSARRLAQVASWGQEAPVKVRKRPKNPLESTLNLVGTGGPKPSERTEQILRRYALLEEYKSRPDRAVNQLMDHVQREPTLEMVNAWTELAYIRAHTEHTSGNDDIALGWYFGALTQAFAHLFDERLRDQRNVFDPAFRKSCDIYNQSIEGMLRIIAKRKLLKPDSSIVLRVADRDIHIHIRLEGRWKSEPIEEIKFASDYLVQGLRNQYQSFGLGVPLIATRAGPSEQDNRIGANYYPPGLTFPLTAYFEVCDARPTAATFPYQFLGKMTSISDQRTSVGPDSGAEPQLKTEFVLHLVDPLESGNILINGQVVPLESDTTTPLAYFLKDPLINTSVFSTLALLDGEFAKGFHGLYLLEPYNPHKIPVVMVHGLWSSPTTWTEMFNDLRADAEIRDRYQFWFYLYHSGQPFWVSAHQMREDLQRVRQELDPYRNSVAMDHMVLIGHSMGGLISRLQTLESRDDFWNIVSDRPIYELKGDPELIREMSGIFYFSPNPSIRRVITIGTPHKGSEYANDSTRWLSRKLIRLPKRLIDGPHSIVKANPDYFRNPKFFEIATSIDSLSPNSQYFERMANAQRAPWVSYHNIVGIVEPHGVEKWIFPNQGESDGVVTAESAISPDTISEQRVGAGHAEVHRHPVSILEVRRILHENLNEYESGVRITRDQHIRQMQGPIENRY
ncbi:MAG TPA: hypothetical protein PKD64_11630 [Pirellulaceae bacterium]|nr:hypothetical protein [Pirellulaceae bacterium]HMO92834.1 hypothetical protein [Pirellulaceae bacterium]HMP69424.1 hypothetical protein [Pirellulaceae bacterium]